MEEDIKIQDLIEHIRFGTQLKYDMKTYLIAIENLIARYKELDKKNTDLLLKLEMKKMLFVRQDKTTKELLTELYIRKDEIEKDFIPKSKVKEKIEKLNYLQKRADDIKNGLKIETRVSANKKDRERSKKELEQFEIPELINKYQVMVLQELLED